MAGANVPAGTPALVRSPPGFAMLKKQARFTGSHTAWATSRPIRQVCPQILSTLLNPPITIDHAAALSRSCRLVGPVEMDTIYSLRDRGGFHARSTKRHRLYG